MLFKVSLGAVYVWTLFIKIHKEHTCPCLLAIGEKRRWYVHQPLSHTWQHSSKCVVVSQASFIFEPVKQREGFLFKLQCCIGHEDCRELNLFCFAGWGFYALEARIRVLGLLQFNCIKIDSFKLKWISWTSWTQKTTSEHRIGWGNGVALEGIIFRHGLKFRWVNFEAISYPSQRWGKEWMSKRNCDEARWIWMISITCQNNNYHLSIEQLLQRWGLFLHSIMLIIKTLIKLINDWSIFAAG